MMRRPGMDRAFETLRTGGHRVLAPELPHQNMSGPACQLIRRKVYCRVTPQMRGLDKRKPAAIF